MSILRGRDALEKNRPSGEYFYIEDISVKQTTWEDKYEDWARWKIGNCFKTKEKAYEHIEFLIMSARLQKFADANNSEIVWNGKNPNYVLSYKHNLAVIEVVPCLYQNYGTIIFSSEEIATAAIKEFGEKEIIKYYFRVKGD